MSIAGVRAGIADALNDVVELTPYAYVPNMVNVPAAVVGWPDAINLRSALGGYREYAVPVTLYVEWASDRAGDEALSELIEAVVEVLAQTDLGGAAEDIAVSTVRSFGVATVGEIQYLTCQIVVEVFE